MTHNPASQVARPTVVNTAPRELTPEQRYVLKNRLKPNNPHDNQLFLHLVIGPGYPSVKWRSSEEQCQVNQRSGQITILDSKDGKTRTIDLHNEVRRALYNYLYKEEYTRRDARDPDSVYVWSSSGQVVMSLDQ